MFVVFSSVNLTNCVLFTVLPFSFTVANLKFIINYAAQVCCVCRGG